MTGQGAEVAGEGAAVAAPRVLAGFDFDADGSCLPAADQGLEPPSGRAWRWLHLDATDAATRAWIESVLPAAPAQALLQYETRPRCDALARGVIVNLRGINPNPGQDPDDMVSVRLWLTPRLVLSSRFRPVRATDALIARCHRGDPPATPGEFLSALAEGLSEHIDAMSVQLAERIDGIEQRMLKGGAIDGEVPELRTTAIKLRRFVAPQREALTRLSRVGEPLLDATAQAEILEAADITAHAIEELDSVANRLAALQDHESARITARMARQNNVLSVVAAIFLPLSFVTGLFGMNLAGIPLADHAWSFAFVTLATIVAGLLLALLLRLMHWY